LVPLPLVPLLARYCITRPFPQIRMIFTILFVLIDLIVQILLAVMSVVNFIPDTAFTLAAGFLSTIYAWSWLVPMQTVFVIIGILIGIVYTEFLFHTGVFIFWLLRNTFKPSWI